MPETNTTRAPQYDDRMSMRFMSTRRQDARTIAKAIGQDETFVFRFGLRYALEKFSKDPMALLKYSIRKNKQDEKEKK